MYTVEARLSRFRPESELSRLNTTAGRAVPVSRLLWNVVACALESAHRTAGLYDPTVLEAREAAGYDRTFEALAGNSGPPGVPPPPLYGWRDIERDSAAQTIALPPGVRLDLGGTAKGWAADRAAEQLATLGPCLLVLGGVGGLILWTGLRLQAAVVEGAARDLQIQALLMTSALSEPLEEWHEGKGARRSALDSLVRSLAQSVGARVVVLDASLRVLFSSDAVGAARVGRQHPEIVAAQQGHVQADVRWDERRQEQRLFVAAPIKQEAGELEGMVQLSAPMTPLYGERRRLWAQLCMAGGVVLVVMTLASLLLARQVTGPLRSVTAVAEAMALGKLEQRIIPTGPDEIVRLGQTFNHLAERIRDMLVSQQAFVANAAHELRSSLASIQLRIEMLQRHGPDNAELTQRYLRQMETAVAHLRRLVDHLLALVRLDEGVAAAQSPLDVSPLLYDVADEIAPLAQAAGVRLELDVPAHLPAVLANADAMRMLVRNLLDNAINYTPPGGAGQPVGHHWQPTRDCCRPQHGQCRAAGRHHSAGDRHRSGHLC
jgi:signal transduction histidine kinase